MKPKIFKNFRALLIISLSGFLFFALSQSTQAGTTPATVTANGAPFSTLYFTPQIEIPNSGISGKTALSGNPDNDGVITSNLLGVYIKAIYSYGLSVAGILAAIVMMAGGIMWLTSGGDSGKVSKAKSFIGGSLVGLFLLFGTYIILNTINPKLLEVKELPVTASQITGIETTICCHPQTGKLEIKIINLKGKTYYYGGDKDGQEFKGCETDLGAVNCQAPNNCYSYGQSKTYVCYSKENVCCTCRIGSVSRKVVTCFDDVSEDECKLKCDTYNQQTNTGTVRYTLNITTPPSQVFDCVKKSDTESFCESNIQ